MENADWLAKGNMHLLNVKSAENLRSSYPMGLNPQSRASPSTHVSPELGRDRDNDSGGNKTRRARRAIERESEGKATDRIQGYVCREEKKEHGASAEDRGDASDKRGKKRDRGEGKGRHARVERGRGRKSSAKERESAGGEGQRGQRLWVESNNWLGMLRAAPLGSPADA